MKRVGCIGVAIAAASAVLAFASAASATVYSVVDDFGSPVFSYGQGTGATFFTAMSHTTCGTGLDCYQAVGGLPEVIKNNGSADFTGNTLDIPPGTVFFHPGPNAAGDDAIIRFTVPTAGVYKITGDFARRDVTANGDGTTASIYETIGGTATSLVSSFISPTSYGSSTPFSVSTGQLAVGDTVEFVLNNHGEYSFDSTGVAANLTLAPVAGVAEPGAWALMIVGAAGAGIMLRRRRAEAMAI